MAEDAGKATLMQCQNATSTAPSPTAEPICPICNKPIQAWLDIDYTFQVGDQIWHLECALNELPSVGDIQEGALR
jgi:hypothetical protein